MSHPEPARIEDIAPRMEAAFNAGDAAALAALYANTAILMPPNEPTVRGRADIQGWFEQALTRLRHIRIIVTESLTEGDHAFQAGTFTSSPDAASSSSAGGPGATVAGKYMLRLKKYTGGWKIQYDIWNLDQPAG
jgi:ketosteroid isomerase-like protein